MNNVNNIKPPNKRRLFLFLLVSFFHIISLLFIHYNIKYTLLIVLEFFFFLYFSKISLNILFKIIIITSIIFLLNIFFHEGKIIIKYGFIKITEHGLKSGWKKASLLISTFFLTYNTLKNNKDIILKYFMYNSNKNILSSSINYFFIFWESLGNKYNTREFFLSIIKIYKKKPVLNNKDESNTIFLNLDFFIYQSSFFILFIIIFIL